MTASVERVKAAALSDPSYANRIVITGFLRRNKRRPQRVVALAQQCYSVVRICAASELLCDPAGEPFLGPRRFEHLRAPVGGEGKAEHAAARVKVAELMSLEQNCGGASRRGLGGDAGPGGDLVEDGRGR